MLLSTRAVRLLAASAQSALQPWTPSVRRRPPSRLAERAVASRAAMTLDAMAHMESCIPGFQRWIDECNEGTAVLHKFVPFYVQGRVVGYLVPEWAQELLRFPDVFRQQQQLEQGNGGQLAAAPPAVCLSPAIDAASPKKRTGAVAGVLGTLRGEGKVEGWRDELYPVVGAFHEEPVLLVERAAAALFGIKAYGVHINGYVTLPDGTQELWVARRSRYKPTWPGKLDHLVAGGQPHGLSCADNVIKECEEEASIPEELAQRVRPVGAVSYTSLKLGGLGRDVLFCYDLELPVNFVPQPQDGEVEEFMRMPLPRVASLIASPGEDFKTNCNLVIIDFLIRHGHLTPDMKGYCQLLTGLRAGDCS